MWVKVLNLLSNVRKFPFFRFLLILGLRVFGVGTRTPFTGGAEALLRHTGRDGGDAETEGWRIGKTVETLRRDWGIFEDGAGGRAERLAHLFVLAAGCCSLTLIDN